LTRTEQWSLEAKPRKLARDTLEDGRILFALRLQLGVPSADELIYIQPQHVQHFIDGTRRLLLGEPE